MFDVGINHHLSYTIHENLTQSSFKVYNILSAHTQTHNINKRDRHWFHSHRIYASIKFRKHIKCVLTGWLRSADPIIALSASNIKTFSRVLAGKWAWVCSVHIRTYAWSMEGELSVCVCVCRCTYVNITLQFAEWVSLQWTIRSGTFKIKINP